MGFSTGRSAAKSAKRRAKQLEYFNKQKEKRALIMQMLSAQQGLASRTVASGAGVESSALQGTEASVYAQGAAQLNEAKRIGREVQGYEKKVKKAKKGAAKLGTIIDVAALALAIPTSGASLALAGQGTAIGGLITGNEFAAQASPSGISKLAGVAGQAYSMYSTFKNIQGGFENWRTERALAKGEIIDSSINTSPFSANNADVRVG